MDPNQRLAGMLLAVGALDVALAVRLGAQLGRPVRLMLAVMGLALVVLAGLLGFSRLRLV